MKKCGNVWMAILCIVLVALAAFLAFDVSGVPGVTVEGQTALVLAPPEPTPAAAIVAEGEEAWAALMAEDEALLTLILVSSALLLAIVIALSSHVLTAADSIRPGRGFPLKMPL